MKITIEFNNVEKELILNTADVTVTEEMDKNQKVKGKFGFYSYNKDGNIVIDIKETFIASYTTLISRFSKIILDVIELYMDFITEWLDDIEVVDEEDSEEELICPVERLKPSEQLIENFKQKFEKFNDIIKNGLYREDKEELMNIVEDMRLIYNSLEDTTEIDNIIKSVNSFMEDNKEE